MRSFALLVHIIILPLFVHAQSAEIGGKISATHTENPLPEVHIFIPGTTFQSFSDSSGTFLLSGIPNGKWAIQARLSGYQVFSDSILVKPNETPSLTIKLTKETKTSISESSISKTKREKLTESFLDKLAIEAFDEVAILNPDSLVFSTENKSTITSARGPIFISNPQTGYLVTVYFDPFELETSEVIGLTYTYFELPDTNLDPEIRKKVRLDRYENSPASFLAQLMEGKSTKFDQDLQPKISFAPNPGDYLLEFSNPFYVTLPNGKKAGLAYKGTALGVKLNGSPSNLNEVVFEGHWTNSKPVSSLPSNFNGDRLVRLANVEKDPEFMEERVYVHTDRKSYWPGENLYFKAYLGYQNPLLADELSRVLHVELVDTAGYSWLHQVHPIDHGVSLGSIALPKDVSESTNLFLRAYTAWSRNYPEGVFYQPLQIASHFRKSQSQPIQPISNGVSIFSDKPSYEGGETVKLSLMVLDEQGKPINANLSVAVLDLNQASYIPDWQNISDRLEQNPEKNLSSVEPKFDIEKGIILEGKLLDSGGIPKSGRVKAFINGYEDIREFRTDAEGRFVMPQSTFTDDFEINLQATDREGNPIRDIQLSIKNYPDTLIPKEVVFPKIENREQTPSVDFGSQIPLDADEVLLSEALIEDKKVPSIGPMIYGNPDNVVETKNLFLNGTPIQFIYALAGKVPGMLIAGTPPSIRFRGGEPLVLVNGSPMNTPGNGGLGASSGQTAYTIISQIDIFSIERVEVIKRLVPQYGDLGRNGIISIILKNGMDMVSAREASLNNFTLFKLKGLQSSDDFPDAEKSRLENPTLSPFRPTLFWKDEVITSQNQMTTSFSFQTNDKPGPILVDIRGITEFGKPISGTFILNQHLLSEN